MTTPKGYNLRDGVSVTALPCPYVTLLLPVPTVSAQTAVRGALAGVSRSSSASLVKSLSTSTS